MIWPSPHFSMHLHACSGARAVLLRAVRIWPCSNTSTESAWRSAWCRWVISKVVRPRIRRAMVSSTAQLDLSETTVKVHRRQIMRKMRAHIHARGAEVRRVRGIRRGARPGGSAPPRRRVPGTVWMGPLATERARSPKVPSRGAFYRRRQQLRSLVDDAFNVMPGTILPERSCVWRCKRALPQFWWFCQVSRQRPVCGSWAFG